MTHLSWHLNDRLDKGGVSNSVGHREDGSHRGHMVDHRLNCVGKDGGGVGEKRGSRVGEKRAVPWVLVEDGIGWKFSVNDFYVHGLVFKWYFDRSSTLL